jgi:hypothetical protein
MVNHSVNINKMNNHLSTEPTEHDHDIWHWKSTPFVNGSKCNKHNSSEIQGRQILSISYS